jgi:hypothetical protein
MMDKLVPCNAGSDISHRVIAFVACNRNKPIPLVEVAVLRAVSWNVQALVDSMLSIVRTYAIGYGSSTKSSAKAKP